MDVEDILLKIEYLEDCHLALKEFFIEKMISLGKKIDKAREEHRTTSRKIKKDLKSLSSTNISQPKRGLKVSTFFIQVF